VAGSLAGAAGMGGAAVSGTAGAAGDNGSGGTGGVPGTGGVGTGGDGPAGTSGAAGVSGEAGAAGNAAAGNTGAGGNAGSAGTGGRGGFFGFGGRGGRGGNGGSSSCPVAGCGPCFRCGAMGCEPEPAATWKVVCESAIIAPTKPSGNAWDPNASSGPGNGPLPDAFCELTVDSRSKSSSIDGDSLMPVWNDDVTPGMASLTAAVLTSNDDRWQLMVIDQDNATSSMETICTVNHVTAADLMGGSATFTQVDSCTELVLRLQCAAGPSQP
jgi:hypothetical protein